MRILDVAHYCRVYDDVHFDIAFWHVFFVTAVTFFSHVKVHATNKCTVKKNNIVHYVLVYSGIM